MVAPQKPSTKMQYVPPDEGKMERIVEMARNHRDNYSDVPTIGYNLLLTIAWLADQRDELQSRLDNLRG
jgi:hypothetical protein